MPDSEQMSEGYEFLSRFGIEQIKRIYEHVARTGLREDTRCPGAFEEGIRLPNLIDEFDKGLKERVNSRAPLIEIAAWAFHFFIFRQPLKNCNHRTALAIMDQILGAFGHRLVTESDEELLDTLEKFERYTASEDEIRDWIAQNLSAI